MGQTPWARISTIPYICQNRYMLGNCQVQYLILMSEQVHVRYKIDSLIEYLMSEQVHSRVLVKDATPYIRTDTWYLLGIHTISTSRTGINQVSIRYYLSVVPNHKVIYLIYRYMVSKYPGMCKIQCIMPEQVYARYLLGKIPYLGMVPNHKHMYLMLLLWYILSKQAYAKNQLPCSSEQVSIRYDT